METKKVKDKNTSEYALIILVFLENKKTTNEKTKDTKIDRHIERDIERDAGLQKECGLALRSRHFWKIS